LLIALACNRAPPSAAEASTSAATASASSAPTSLAAHLVDVDGFAASPIETAPEYVRRIYTRGKARIILTIGRTGSMRLDEWKRTTKKYGYPIASLGVSDDEAFGFYDCDDAGSACDLHVHTARGLHIEVQSGATATRADLEALVAGLPMRALAAE
jgi:hypothetical protein